MVSSLWPVESGNTLGAVRGFLRTLLEKDVASALLVPAEGPDHSLMPALLASAGIERANPLAPVMALNSARLVSLLTREDLGGMIGAVLRPCEIRALVELVKFNQIKLDRLVVIGVDCLGTLALPEYLRAVEIEPELTPHVLSAMSRGKLNGQVFRTACELCDQPVPANADILIGLIGLDNQSELLVELREDIADQLGLRPDAATVAGRNAALEGLVAARVQAREAAVQEFRKEIQSDGGLQHYFAACVECTNCMTACPICYCKECFFRTDSSQRSSRELLRAALRRGARNLPPDAILFQLTRLNHMALSCVGCGMCEAACPQHLPLTVMFRAVGARVQKLFDYLPGRDVNDKPPFMEFRQDELLELGRGPVHPAQSERAD